MRRRFAAPCATSLVATLIAACAVGPDYHRPNVDVPAAYRYAIADVTETANTAWWHQFDDLVLDQLIADALANNKNVLIAAANVEQAAGVFVTARSPLFPQLGYTGSGSRQRLPDALLLPGENNPDSRYQAFATASWEIDLWGRIRRETEAARANLFATQEARRGVLLSLVSAVATAYLDLRALDAQLDIANSTVDAYAESVRLFDLQFKHGVVSEMTVDQAEAQYEGAVAQRSVIEQQIVVAENVLSILLGRNPGSIPRGKAIGEFAPPTVPAGLPSDLLMRRPDIAQAEQNLIAANAQIGAAKALYFPTISLTGLLGGTSGDLSNLFDNESKTWNYAGSIVGPIFTGGAISGQVAQAKASQKAALAAYENAIQSAFADVENALSARTKLTDQLAAQQRLVDALQGYARLALLQYNGGYTSYLTVLYANQQLFPAQLQLAQVQAALLNSVTDIYKATGGGWIDEADKLAPQPVDGGWLFPDVVGSSNR
jgi:multidrug efflux system outer membrane protein